MRIPIYMHFTEAAQHIRAIDQEIANINRDKVIPRKLFRYDAGIDDVHGMALRTAALAELRVARVTLTNDGGTWLFAESREVPDTHMLPLMESWRKSKKLFESVRERSPKNDVGRQGVFLASSIIGELEGRNRTVCCQRLGDIMNNFADAKALSWMLACTGNGRTITEFWRNLNAQPDWAQYASPVPKFKY